MKIVPSYLPTIVPDWNAALITRADEIELGTSVRTLVSTSISINVGSTCAPSV